LRAKVGNYAGVTVERKEGRLLGAPANSTIRVLDLPGTYSLTAYSIEERVTRSYLLEERPDIVVQVVDAANLARNLYLAVQLLELGVDLVLDLNMWDEFQATGARLDVETFENAAAGCKGIAEQDLTGDQALQLEQAHTLYQGDLLEGVYDDWCLIDRERLWLLHLDILKKLMVFHSLHGNYERALAYGQQILRQDATREGVHRHLMWLYWQAGDRGAALAQYKRCVQLLQEELGVAPMAQTTQLYQAIINRPAEAMSAGRELWSGRALASPLSTTRPAVATEAWQALQHLEEVLAAADSELHHLRSLLATLRDESGYSRDQEYQLADIW